MNGELHRAEIERVSNGYVVYQRTYPYTQQIAKTAEEALALLSLYLKSPIEKIPTPPIGLGGFNAGTSTEESL